MRKPGLLFTALAMACVVCAQPKAVEGTADFQRSKQPAAIIELPYPESIVQKGIEEFMLKKGAKGSDNRDYTVFRGYKIDSHHDYSSDLYFKTERKGRKDKDVSVVYLVTGKTGTDIKTRNTSDDKGLDGAAALLEELAPFVEAYNLDVQIKDQETMVKKLEGKISDLVEDSVSIDKKRRALDDKIQQNVLERQKQKTEMDKQQGVLEAMKGRTNSR
jgi:hypothetical protein